MHYCENEAPSNVTENENNRLQTKAIESTNSATKITGGSCITPMPKHIPFPEFSNHSEILNELIMFLFITCTAAMQFINIYRSVWWFQESYTNHIVNVHLIEPYLIMLILTLFARRLVYCTFLQLLELMKNAKRKRIYRNGLKYGFSCIVLGALSYCIVKICIKHSFLSFFLLIYPFIVYFLIFGFQIDPFLRSSHETEGIYFNDMPVHSCSSNASLIREEIEVLKNDFNNRLIQIIFTSFINAYYAGFVPCFFAVGVYYNVTWTTQHCFLVWLSGFTLCIIFILPSKYSDILHRASLHLGYWHRIENRVHSPQVNQAISIWNKNMIWSNGSTVKHNGETFRCVGPATVALPGNSSHSRFYKLFHNPSIIYMTVTSAQAVILVAEIVLLYCATEWHFLLSITFITFTNQFTFFKIMRDYLITKRIYSAETSITDKQLYVAD